MKTRSAFLFFLFLLLSLGSQAEYRVFKLHFENTKTKATKQILSTLDPEQYKGIYPLEPNETVTYVQTWRCKGSTSSFKPYCQSPVLKP